MRARSSVRLLSLPELDRLTATRRATKMKAIEPFADDVVTPLPQSEDAMLGTILIILLVLFLAGALPTWGHSRESGSGPSGLLGTILAVVVILVLLRYI
jgi:hypothetical protein